MFHITSLGSNAQRFFGSVVDIDGYVPETGDDWRDMRYDHGSNSPLRMKRELDEIKEQYNALIEQGKNKASIDSEISHMEWELNDLYQYMDRTWWPQMINRAQALLEEWYAD